MPGQETEADAQDQSEVFDETHIDDEGEGDLLLDEAGPVFDVTRAEGDGGDQQRWSGRTSGETGHRRAANLIEAEADMLLGRTGRRDMEGNGDRDDPSAPDEIELVYTGLMREVRGAQASAAHWEARRLSDDDIADLGYGPDADTDDPDSATRSAPHDQQT